MKNIWLKNSQPPPATDAEIQYTEEYFQVELPKSYKELLKIHNGGSITPSELDLSSFQLPPYIDPIIDVAFLDGIYLDNPDTRGIWDTEKLRKTWGVKRDKLIFIAGDGHYWITLDYSKNPMSAVYVDTEFEGKIFELYSSFDEMLEKLGNYSEMEDFNMVISKEELAKLLYSDDIEDIVQGIVDWDYFFDENPTDYFADRIIDIFDILNSEIQDTNKNLGLQFTILRNIRRFSEKDDLRPQDIQFIQKIMDKIFKDELINDMCKEIRENIAK